MNDLPRELHHLLHDLWTRDVGTPGYEKAKWKRLSVWLYFLVRYLPEGALAPPGLIGR